MNGRVALVALLLGCGTGSPVSSDGGSDASVDAGSPFLMPSPIGDVKYGLARSYDGGALFGTTWTTTPEVNYVFIMSSAPIDCTTDFSTETPVTDVPVRFVFPFFLNLDVDAEAQIIGLDSVASDGGVGGGSSGQKPALDAYIKSSTSTYVGGTINFNGFAGSFAGPVCP